MSSPGNSTVPRIPYSAPLRQIVNVDELAAALSDRMVAANAMNLGVNGAEGIDSGDGAQAGNWFALQMVGDTVLSALTAVGDSGSPLTGLTLPSGMVIYGNFTAVTVTSGYVRAYNKQV
jgi:hypothetical protein